MEKYKRLEMGQEDISDEALAAYNNSSFVFAKNLDGKIDAFDSEIGDRHLMAEFDTIQEVSEWLEKTLYDFADWKVYSEEMNCNFGTRNKVITDGTRYVGLEHWNGETWRGYDSDKYGVATGCTIFEVRPVYDEETGVQTDFEVDE